MNDTQDVKTARRTASAPTDCSAIRIGDLFWDKNRDWCDGSSSLNVCYLILSADQEGDLYVYRCAFFMWAGDGYCGSSDRKFTKDEVLKMTKVGSIESIKSFGQNESNETRKRR